MAQGIANVEALTHNVARVLEHRPQNGSSGTELSGRSAAAAITGVNQAVAKVPESIIRLRQEDIDNLTTAIGYDLADNTRKNYLGQWRRFCAWALNRGISPLPADPEQVAAYLDERFQQQEHRPATLYSAAAAISFIHRTAELDDPCDTPKVKCTLRSATRKAGNLQRQAEALTAESLVKIRATACQPRRGRGGRFESPETARRRGKADIAMISLMRDAMLRVAETAALTWADIEARADGTGRLLIRRSKTDAVGEGAVVFISTHTMDALNSIRGGAADWDSLFGLRPNQISRRIKQAAQAAGLGDGFSGHSPRIGMACDLARVGTELPSLMTAGRWSSPRMPALYIRNETAARGAVAQYYSGCQQVP